MAEEEGCEHTKKADKEKAAVGDVCQDCIREKTHWVELRVCLTCGNVGCCDSSVGRHATKHFQKTQHPVMAEFPNRGWIWCYVDKAYG